MIQITENAFSYISARDSKSLMELFKKSHDPIMISVESIYVEILAGNGIVVVFRDDINTTFDAALKDQQRR